MVRTNLEKTCKSSTHMGNSSAHGKKKEEKNTNTIKEEAQKELAKLEKMVKTVDKFQSHAPKGCLKYQNKGNSTYFYQQYMNEQTKQWERKYIKKDNISLVRKLAQKHYYAVLKPALERNIKALRNFIRQYHPEDMEEIYEDLSVKRKELIEPFMSTKDESIRKWFEEKYEVNNLYPENLRFETEQGEQVRSKSEVIIANILYQHKKVILYKYERPLEIFADGKCKTIFPDFTILNVHTGRIIYWEHAGRMDDPYYTNEFVKKMNTYIANNLLPGRDVIVTFETMGNALDISVVKKLVSEMCVSK